MTSTPPGSPAATLTPADAGPLLRAGGVIAYPTEGVWGLGCDPGNASAVLRLLDIKQREVGKGVILIAADIAQLDDVVHWDGLPSAARDAVFASWPGPHTWIVPAQAAAPRWVTGDHDGIAVRVSDHPLVVALCRAFGGAIVSTSANLAGHPAPRSRAELDPSLLARIDAVVDGETAGLARPSAMRDARSGRSLR